MASDERIGIGVIGVGIRGQHAYEQWLAQRGDCRIVAVAQQPDPSPVLLEGKDPTECARSWAEKLGAEYVERWQDVIKRPDISVISLMCDPSVSPMLMGEIAVAGKHIIRDKFLAASPQVAEEAVRACERAGVEVLVTYNVRYMPAIRALLRELRQNSIGRPIAATFVYIVGGGPLEGFRASTEYMQRVGGGELLNFGVYAVDVLLEVFGELPEAVYCSKGTYFYDDYASVGMEDMAQLTLCFSGGRLAHLVTGRTTTLPAPTDFFWLDVTGEKGTLTAKQPQPEGIISREGRHQGIGWQQAWAVQEMLEDFVESLKRGRPSPIPARRGLEVLQVIHAGYASSVSGEPVRVR